MYLSLGLAGILPQMVMSICSRSSGTRAWAVTCSTQDTHDADSACIVALPCRPPFQQQPLNKACQQRQLQAHSQTRCHLHHPHNLSCSCSNKGRMPAHLSPCRQQGSSPAKALLKRHHLQTLQQYHSLQHPLFCSRLLSLSAQLSTAACTA